MATKRMREVVWEPPSPNYLMERARRGWTLVALEWEREMDAEEARKIGLICDVPYGLRVAANSLTLEENPAERAIIGDVLGLIVRDELRFSDVADALNARGYQMRDGKPWSQTAVFDMLPRLIEVAPEILSSEEWEALKRRF
jgi:hypothetical protein